MRSIFYHLGGRKLIVAAVIIGTVYLNSAFDLGIDPQALWIGAASGIAYISAEGVKDVVEALKDLGVLGTVKDAADDEESK